MTPLWGACRRLLIIGAGCGGLWLAGLLWFATPPVADRLSTPTDAIVVLTGGSLRLQSGIELLRQGKGRMLFVSGVNQEVDLDDVLRVSGNASDWIVCCVSPRPRGREYPRQRLGDRALDPQPRFPQSASGDRLVPHAAQSSRIQPGNAGNRYCGASCFSRAGQAGTMVDLAGDGGLAGERIPQILGCSRPAACRMAAAVGGRRAESDASRVAPMIWARAFAFNFIFFAWTAVIGTLGLPILLTTQRLAMRRPLLGTVVLALLKAIVGLTHEARGLDNIPRDGCIVAMKHQSAWDTLILPVVLDNPAIVLKRELLFVPFFGWYAARAGTIAIDRKAGAGALRRMLERAQPLAAARRTIVIFPEGTRVAPGEHRPYQPGVAALYQALTLPVVPAAVNSGLYWRRRSFLKRRGRIVLEFLDPIPPGWPRDRLMAELEKRIETATAALLQEGQHSVKARSLGRERVPPGQRRSAQP